MQAWTESFIFGIANSLHCAGMCGPLALCFRGGASATTLYHVGRIASYSLVGALVGSIGVGLGATSIPTGWISLALGALMIAIACGAPLLSSIGVANPLLTRVFARVRAMPPALGGLAVGAATPLLPCGVLCVAAAMALPSGGALPGSWTMLFFALGSVPALLLTQLNVRWLGAKLGPTGRARLFRALLLVAATVLVYRVIVALNGESCCH